MEKDYANYLLTKTREDYNRIAKQFSDSRNYLWEELLPVFEYIESGSVLDLGCGNGRFFKFFKEKPVDYVGVDFSKELIKIAKKKHPKASFKKANALDLPFKKGSFDSVLSVAVMHHIPSHEFRKKLLEEIKRILKSDGKVILTVWGMPFLKKLKLITRFSILKFFGLTKLDFKDVFVPWGKTKRYVHLFSKKELESLVEEVGFKVVKSGEKVRDSGHGNIYIVAQKKA